MPLPRPSEARRDRRSKALTFVFAFESSEYVAVKCVLKDVSASGCRIVGSGVEALGKRFYLRAEDWPEPRRCEMVWRGKRTLGARFIEVPPED